MPALACRIGRIGCCGKEPLWTEAVLTSLGLWPLPAIHSSGAGLIAPAAGTKSTCVYVYEKLIGEPYEGLGEPCEVLRRRLLDKTAGRD